MPRPRKGQLPTQQSANGALPAQTLPSKATSAPAKSPSTVKATASKAPSHQTHGAVTPTGPITHAQQLYRGKNVAKGSIGSFDTAEAYTSYLDGLTDAQLQAHAANEAHLVPIDDRRRLMLRLETEWHKSNSRITTNLPKRAGYSPEQMAAHNAMTKTLLSRLA